MLKFARIVIVESDSETEALNSDEPWAQNEPLARDLIFASILHPVASPSTSTNFSTWKSGIRAELFAPSSGSDTESGTAFKTPPPPSFKTTVVWEDQKLKEDTGVPDSGPD